MLRKLYYNICERIYSVGRLRAEKKRIERLKTQGIIPQSSVIHETGSLLNLAGKGGEINVGENCHIYGSLTVLSGIITVGDYCTIGDMTRIVSRKSITIGNRVMIAHNVNIFDNNSHPTDAVLRHQDFLANYNGNTKEFDAKAAEIIIEDDVWIGFNSIILKGVKIGQGAIIGAGSIVAKDVEPWTINVGNPLRIAHKLK